MNPLDDAIERLYVTFQNVPLPRHIDGCPCCLDEKGLAAMLATPLRLISPADLASYASSALLTVGEVSDYLYFLPRILEISARDDTWWPDIEVTARAIHSTDLPAWPSRRRVALDCFLHAVIAEVLAAGEYGRLDDWLCAIARMELDVSSYLSQIETNPAAVLQYFEVNADGLRKGVLSNAFWEHPNAGHDAIVQWFKSEAIRKIPFEAYGYVM